MTIDVTELSRAKKPDILVVNAEPGVDGIGDIGVAGSPNWEPWLSLTDSWDSSGFWVSFSEACTRKKASTAGCSTSTA